VQPSPPIGQRPLPTLAALLPLILFLEVSLLLGGPSLTAARVLAHEHIGQALSFFGLSPTFVLHATGFGVIAVLLTWHTLTGDPWKVRVRDAAWLLLEGCIAMAPLLAAAAFFGMLRETALAAPAGIVPTSTIDAIALAIGAGLSEELLFRMVGVACVHWILADMCGVKNATTLIVAVVVTAAAFTLYHDPNSLSSAGLIFVAAAGLYLGVLYVMRGFAVAVVAHAGYDAIVLLAIAAD
jgi:membrane protease YdiL (CAAX protease family)